MRERDIEAYFVKRVKEAGGLQRKFVSPGVRGVPDRIAFFPVGRIYLIEFKAPDGKLSVHQAREIDRLFKVGFEVWIIRDFEWVDILIERATR